MKKYLGVILALAAFVALWHVTSVLVNRPILPGPAATTAAFVRLAAEGRLWQHVGVSFTRVTWALIGSAIPAFILGLATGRSARLNRLISPFIYLLHPSPKAAFLPVIILFFGIGEAAKIFLIAFIIFSQMLVSVRDATRQVAGEYMDIVRSMGAGRLSLLRHVIIPAALPGFFTAFRISLGIATAVLFIAETFVSRNGLGHLILDAWIRLAFTEMYAAIMALSIMGLLLFIITDILELIFCPWQNSGKS